MASQSETNTWAMVLHLSVFAGYIVPLAGFVAPIVIWQVQKSSMPELDAHGRIVVNWIISSLIYGAIAFVLSFVGIGLILLAALGVIGIVFPIIGAVKASSGIAWKYPLSINLV